MKPFYSREMRNNMLRENAADSFHPAVVENLVADCDALEDRNAELEREAARPKGLSDEDVWMRVFIAVASCHNSTRIVSVEWADHSLTIFRKRFPRA